MFHRAAKNKQIKKKILLATDIRNAAVKDATASLTWFAGRAFSGLKLAISVEFIHRTLSDPQAIYKTT